MRNNKRRIGFTHARMNFSQSENSSLLYGQGDNFFSEILWIKWCYGPCMGIHWISADTTIIIVWTKEDRVFRLIGRFWDYHFHRWPWVVHRCEGWEVAKGLGGPQMALRGIPRFSVRLHRLMLTIVYFNTRTEHKFSEGFEGVGWMVSSTKSFLKNNQLPIQKNY